MLNSPSRRRAHGKKHGVQGIVVEFVATGQCIVVEMFEARLSADFAQSLQAPSLRQQ